MFQPALTNSPSKKGGYNGAVESSSRWWWSHSSSDEDAAECSADESYRPLLIGVRLAHGFCSDSVASYCWFGKVFLDFTPTGSMIRDGYDMFLLMELTLVARGPSVASSSALNSFRAQSSRFLLETLHGEVKMDGVFSFLMVRDLKFVCKAAQVNQIWRNVTTGCKTCKIMGGSMSKYVIYKRPVVWKWISFKMLRCKRSGLSGHVRNMFDLICCYLVANPNQLQIISETAWGSLRVALRVRMHGAVIVGRLWRKCLIGYVGMYVQRGLLGFGILITYTVYSMDELCIWSSVSFSSNLWIPKPSKPRASSFHLPPLGHQGLRQPIPDTSQVHKVAARWGSFR